MSIYLGTSKIKDLYLGTSKIKEIYLGTSKIYSSTAPFPQGYTKYDYLRAVQTVNARTSLDINLNVYSKTVMDMMVEGGSSSGSKNVWGHLNTAGQRVWYSQQNSYFLIASSQTISAAKDTRYILTIVKDMANTKLSLTIGDTTVETTSTANVNSIKIGTNYSSAVNGYTRYYSVRIYDINNKLIRDLVPAKRNSDSRSGFVNLAYDENDTDTGALFYQTENESAMYAVNESA